MLQIKKRYYVPNNSALLFAGDIAPAEAFALASEFFGDWKRTEDPHKLYPEPPHPALKSSSTIAIVQPVKSVTMLQAWHGPGMNADMPSTFAADVFSFIISQPNSRFYRNLIDSGAFDRANISYFSQVHTGPINFFGVTSADRFDRAHRAWQEELKHVTDSDYFTDEELKFAKDQLEVSEIYGRERTTEFVHTVSFWWSTGGLNYYADYLDNLRKVTRADVNAYLRRYVIGKPSVTGVLASDEDLPKMTAIKTAQIVRPVKGSSSTAMASTAASDSPTEAFEVDGLRILLRTNKQSEVVSARAFVEGGLAYAGASRAGLEGLVFEIAEKQSQKYPKETMARELTRLGAQLATDAGAPEATAFSLTALRRNFADSFAIFLDALFHPLINDTELGLARERRLTSIAQQEEDPDAYVLRLSLENAYGSHPYALDPLGTRERVSGATVSDLQRVHSDISRSRVLLVVVGNVTRDEVTRLVRPALQGVSQTAFSRTALAPIPDADRVTTRLVARDLPTVYVQGSFSAANIASADFPALYVGMEILGDRLFEEIRMKRNLSYAPAGWIFQRASNLGNVYVSTPDPNAALKVMSDEVRKMRTALVPESEVRNASNTTRTRILRDLQASNDIAAWLGRFAVQTGDWKNFDAFIARIATVTPEEVREAMNKYAHHLDFAVLGKLEGLDEKVLTNF
jgi:predicted Zn-dependent peptidase